MRLLFLSHDSPKVWSLLGSRVRLLKASWHLPLPCCRFPVRCSGTLWPVAGAGLLPVPVPVAGAGCRPVAGAGCRCRRRLPAGCRRRLPEHKKSVLRGLHVSEWMPDYKLVTFTEVHRFEFLRGWALSLGWRSGWSFPGQGLVAVFEPQDGDDQSHHG